MLAGSVEWDAVLSEFRTLHPLGPMSAARKAYNLTSAFPWEPR